MSVTGHEDCNQASTGSKPESIVISMQDLIGYLLRLNAINESCAMPEDETPFFWKEAVPGTLRQRKTFRWKK